MVLASCLNCFLSNSESKTAEIDELYGTETFVQILSCKPLTIPKSIYRKKIGGDWENKIRVIRYISGQVFKHGTCLVKCVESAE